ncbi:MAG TPA: hypothetical protein VK614_11840 [Allosphingosinicella sp.]|nr:hypothetical protein [Allosphingosinicella sp.]
MNGLAIAAAPLGAAGLGTLTQGFPGARPETIRIDAVLSILAEAAAERAAAAAALTIGQEQ